MDTYLVNGVEIEYDTFDVDCMERFGEENKRVDATLKAGMDESSWDGMVAFAREACNAVMDFFDEVVGEGTANKLFGAKANIKEVTDAYAGFVNAVMENTANIGGPKPNRAQRRAAQRNHAT